MKTCAIADISAGLPSPGFLERIGRLSAAGVDLIQLRAKQMEGGAFYRLARECRGRVAQPARLVINGRADVASAVGADGVHLPADGLPAGAVRRIAPTLLVGRSCHSVDDCRAAMEEGADYVVLGPVFGPRSKPGAGRISRDELEQAASLGIDVYALGGIDLERARGIAGSGVAGIAGITLFMMDEPVERIVATVHDL